MHISEHYLALPRLFREQFGYAEEPNDLLSNSPLLNRFYESVGEQYYLTCGYWNGFVHFYALLELRDRYFSLYLEPQTNAPALPTATSGPTLLVDFVLDVVSPMWRKLLPNLDRDNPLDLVRLYAAAIKPFAKDIFVPSIRPSEGFSGFSWWPQVYASLASSKARPNNSFNRKPLRGSG